MITGRNRHKLIQGLVVAMGKPEDGESKPSKSGYSSDSDGPDAEEPDEGSPAEESKDDQEAMSCARDAAHALGREDMDDAKAKSFVEAIRAIAGS